MKIILLVNKITSKYTLIYNSLIMTEPSLTDEGKAIFETSRKWIDKRVYG